MRFRSWLLKRQPENSYISKNQLCTSGCMTQYKGTTMDKYTQGWYLGIPAMLLAIIYVFIH